MLEYADALKRYTDTPEGRARYKTANQCRNELEAAFLKRLRAGEILGSAYKGSVDQREIIPLALWDLLEVDYDSDGIVGERRRYNHAEFFEPWEIPSNVLEIPDWVSDLPSFQLPPSVVPTLLAQLPILFAVQGHSVEFNGGLTLKGQQAELILRLLPNYKLGISEGRRPEEFRCIRAPDLADALAVTEENLRRRIGRVREDIAKAYFDLFKLTLGTDAVIENVGGKGYRVNPMIILVQPFQLSRSDVTNSNGRSASERVI
jgi:hypothetical protein